MIRSRPWPSARGIGTLICRATDYLSHVTTRCWVSTAQSDDRIVEVKEETAFGQRLLHEEASERGDERVIAAEVFGALRCGRHETDAPLATLGRRQDEANRIRQRRGRRWLTGTRKTLSSLSRTIERLSRCAASRTKPRTASGSPNTASVASSSARTSAGRKAALGEAGAVHALPFGIAIPVPVHVTVPAAADQSRDRAGGYRRRGGDYA